MALRYRDFAPQLIARRIIRDNEYESLQDALDSMNLWIGENEVRVVNIETVVLPEIHAEEGTEDVDLRTSGEMGSDWHQFFRVWYHD